MATVEVTREQALAHRLRRQGLDRATSHHRDLAIWDVGVQESPPPSAAQALAARLAGGIGDVPDLADRRSFSTAWAARGAPVVMRSGDEASFAAALWPVDHADAVSRLAGNGQQLRKAGVDPIEAIRVTAEAMHDVVTEPLTKGEVSTEVSARLPEAYITWCRPCQAHHLGDQLMRVAGLPAGLRLVPGASPATLEPIPGWAGVPGGPDGADRFVRALLHLYGPAGPTDLGAWLQTSGKAVRSVWPDELTQVSVDGTKSWLPEEDVDELLAAAPTRGVVRLLPRSDPWLLARDRARVVPDPAARKVLWPALGWPGAVLVDGEVVGAWRTRAATKGTLTVSVEPFATLTAAVRKAVAAEAADIATSRGADDVIVTTDD